MIDDIIEQIEHFRVQGKGPLAIAIAPDVERLVKAEFLDGFNNQASALTQAIQKPQTFAGLPCFIWHIPSRIEIIESRAQFEELKAVYGNPSDRLPGTLDDDILNLALKNPIVRRHYDIYQAGGYSYQDALKQMVIALAHENQRLQQIANDAIARQLPSVIRGVGQPPEFYQ
jgi:hypothetical protein